MSSVNENWINNFDFYGWQDDLDFYGWQDELKIYSDVESYQQMVLWIHTNINNPKNNVYYYYSFNQNKSVFRFRKSKDLAWFSLRWS